MANSIAGEALYQWKQWAIQRAQSNDVDVYEVEWLLQGLTPLTHLSIRLDSYREQSNVWCELSLAQLTEKWQQRVINRVPVQYIAGKTPWRNFSITVSPDVLIPRPETELMIDIAEGLITQSPIADQCDSGDWADLGTGSGAIALGLAYCFPKATIHAIDISPSTLDIAKRNARQNHLAHRIIFYQGSWLSPLQAHIKGKLTGIVSNPPYIPSNVIATLQPEVTNHEPHLALDGGSDGLDCIKHLIEISHHYLNSGGIWLTELMAGQAETVEDLLKQHDSYTHINIHPDLSGIDRFVSARKAL
ncbi:MAG: peptide chain release factor N(5)-glutamine methyltransferase [Cyanobacteria bacterium P01_D01_bin.105]